MCCRILLLVFILPSVMVNFCPFVHGGDDDLAENLEPAGGTCGCEPSVSPVCGSDGKTYSNGCELNCAAMKTRGLYELHQGKCDTETDACADHPTSDTCPCTREFRPVCGSDGKTYGNPCELCCAQKQNPSLTKTKDGPCEKK